MNDHRHLKKVPKQHYKPARDEVWTLDNLRDGLQYFFDLNKRYPKTDEVDKFEYLPSAKTIQRNFGGLVQLREKLGLAGPTDFTKGKTRSKVAAEADLRARRYEEEFYYFLTSRIPEIRVHEHKVIRPANVQSDFFIYTDNRAGIVIDLFYAQDAKTAMKIVNIKSNKYITMQFTVLLILVGNQAITQEMLDGLLKRKLTPLASHIRLLTEKEFKERLFSSYFSIETNSNPTRI